MNKFIARELSKLGVPYSKEHLSIVFPKIEGIRLVEGHVYIVKLSDFMLKPSSISTNWNSNILPQSTYYKAEISKMMGNMIKINGISYDFVNNLDLNVPWSGWVPNTEIEIIKEI